MGPGMAMMRRLSNSASRGRCKRPLRERMETRRNLASKRRKEKSRLSEEERLARDWTIDTGDCCDLDLEYHQTNQILSNTWNIIKQIKYYQPHGVSSNKWNTFFLG